MQEQKKLSRRVFSLLLAYPVAARMIQDFTIRDNVDLVLLDVSVRDHEGGYVTDLPQSAFQVAVDNRKQQISSFSSVDAPVTVGLIVDNSGSMRKKKPEVVIAGLAFARDCNPRDEFFVVNFNDRVTLGLPANIEFTDNINRLHDALYMGRPDGRTALYDAVAYGLKHLEGGHYENRTLIVVSDGGDNISSISEHRVIELIEASRATIFAIQLADPDDPDLRPGILKSFANISGGYYYQPSEVPEVIEVMKKIAADIRHRYTIGFSPSDINPGRSIHQIKVSAMRNGRQLEVRTRKSFSTPVAAQGHES